MSDCEKVELGGRGGGGVHRQVRQERLEHQVLQHPLPRLPACRARSGTLQNM